MATGRNKARLRSIEERTAPPLGLGIGIYDVEKAENRVVDYIQDGDDEDTALELVMAEYARRVREHEGLPDTFDVILLPKQDPE